MTEHLSFEKNIIKNLQNIKIPLYVKSEKRKKDTFNNYQLIKKYTAYTKNK
jgi:hypothetical protein